MSKKLFVCLTAVAFVFSLAIIGGNAIARDAGDAEMVLKTGNAKKPATFPHKKHQDAYDCTTCHHKKDDVGNRVPCGEEDKIQQCATCHNKTDMPDASQKKFNTYKNAAHVQCKGCHKKEKKGPTKCAGCHPKKKK